jgi:hypothetical protein
LSPDWLSRNDGRLGRPCRAGNACLRQKAIAANIPLCRYVLHHCSRGPGCSSRPNQAGRPRFVALPFDAVSPFSSPCDAKCLRPVEISREWVWELKPSARAPCKVALEDWFLQSVPGLLPCWIPSCCICYCYCSFFVPPGRGEDVMTWPPCLQELESQWVARVRSLGAGGTTTDSVDIAQPGLKLALRPARPSPGAAVMSQKLKTRTSGLGVL